MQLTVQILSISTSVFPFLMRRKKGQSKHICTNQKKNTDAENPFEIILLVLKKGDPSNKKDKISWDVCVRDRQRESWSEIEKEKKDDR